MMFYSSFSAIRKLLLAVATIPFITFARAQLSTDELIAKMPTAPAAPGYNVEGGTVFDNFVGLYNRGQLFFLSDWTSVYEKPAVEPVTARILYWCGNLAFSDMKNNSSSYIGYAGRCVGMFLKGFTEFLEAGNQFPFDASTAEFVFTLGISAVFVEQLNLFEGTIHTNSDDVVLRWWDDGRKTMPSVGWETTDEGDKNLNAATSAWSAIIKITWMSTEEVSTLLNKTKADMEFDKVYTKAWIKSHEEEAEMANPYPGEELEIVAQVKNDTETGAASDSNAAGEGDADAAGATDSSTAAGATRKLALATTRVVSAALRLFGI
jgi:hypothetical protein